MRQRNKILIKAALVLSGLIYGTIALLPLFGETQNFTVLAIADSSFRKAQAEERFSEGEATPSQISRQDFYVTSDSGIQIFVREVTTGEYSASAVPILLIHGGGTGSVASFDLDVPNYSLASDFAAAGHPVYLMNMRGWEQSTRPAALDQPAEANPPAVTSEEAVRDIAAVIDEIYQRHQRPVALIGWATGGHWAGMYTSQNNDKVSHLVMLNSLYGVNAPWELRQAFEDPNNPGTFDASGGAYRLSDAEGLLASWNRTIPLEDKTQWREPQVAQAYQETALASDPTSETRNPPSLRIPSAYRLESYNLSRGQKYWEAADVTVPTLVIRGERDFWSRPADLQALEAELVNAPSVETVTIPDGTHYLFLDRPERGRDRFITEVLSFLAQQ